MRDHVARHFGPFAQERISDTQQTTIDGPRLLSRGRLEVKWEKTSYDIKPKKRTANAAVSRRTLLQAGAGLAGTALLPLSLT